MFHNVFVMLIDKDKNNYYLVYLETSLTGLIAPVLNLDYFVLVENHDYNL